MRTATEFQVESVEIGKIVKEAMDDGQMNLSGIAAKAGVSVPTVARLYSQTVEIVHTRTARKVAAALGTISRCPIRVRSSF